MRSPGFLMLFQLIRAKPKFHRHRPGSDRGNFHAGSCEPLAGSSDNPRAGLFQTCFSDPEVLPESAGDRAGNTVRAFALLLQQTLPAFYRDRAVRPKRLWKDKGP